jgi:hypothetical protein
VRLNHRRQPVAWGLGGGVTGCSMIFAEMATQASQM